MKISHLFSRVVIMALIFASFYALLSSCKEDYDSNLKPGRVVFSFSSSQDQGGRSKEVNPAFVSYTLEKPDGSTISDKIELIAFNESFVTQPLDLHPGEYKVMQFIILDASNVALYATPLEGSELADLVEEPLPLSFTIGADEITNVVPQVLKLEDHTPEELGYAAFAFEVVETLTFNENVTIADHNQHGNINHTLEIVAKDAPLGTVKWTKTISMPGDGKVRVPAKYAHYTFKAIKPGYIPHIQHFLATELSGYDTLSFEFIPESLDGFYTSEKTGVKIYFTNDQYRFKLYTRFDLAEGYFLKSARVDKAAVTKGGSPLSFTYVRELTSFANRVNIFDNKPFGIAPVFPLHYTLPHGTANTIDDVNVTSFIIVKYTTDQIVSDFKLWKGANNQ